MKESVFEIIQSRIATVSSQAVATFHEALVTNTSDELFRMGFTSSKSVVDEHKKLNTKEVLRARMIRYFGTKVLFEEEVRKLEVKYQLDTHVASRFKDAIPEVNQMDIINFCERVKKQKLNQGTIETDLYHIPLTTDPFYITAPPECFRKALNPNEMSAEELKAWQEEDPIVWKRIYRFDPSKYGKDKNEPTGMYALVTAWGLESVLINTN
jgi:hypothetical protein